MHDVKSTYFVLEHFFCIMFIFTNEYYWNNYVHPDQEQYIMQSSIPLNGIIN